MGMTDPTPTRRHFRPTPSWLIFGLLVVEGLLWLSERYAWFWFNEKKGWTVLIALAVVSGAMLVMLGWFVAALVFRWRFQFSLRSLLALTVAVAVPSSWLAVKMQEAKRQREAADAILKLGGDVDMIIPSISRSIQTHSRPDWHGDGSRGPISWIAATEVYLPGGDDGELEPLQCLPELLVLSNAMWGDRYARCKFTDAGLARLEALHRLNTTGSPGGEFYR